jgi:hypothetical protein
MTPSKKQIVCNAELDHVIKTIFREDTDDPISLSCLKEGIDSVEKLVSLSSNDIDTMTFEVDEEVNNKIKTVVTPLPKGSKALLCLFKTYVTYEWEVDQKRVTAGDWIAISYDNFNDYRFTSGASYRVMMLNHAHASLVQQANPSTLNTPHPTSEKALSMDPIDIFHQEQVLWQCIKSEDDTLEEVSMFANELFLDVIEMPAVSLQEKTYPNPPSSTECTNFSDKNPFATSVRTAPIDGEKIWQCIKSEYDTLQEVSMLANELFLNVTRMSTIILQENGERVKAQVIADLVDEDLPDPERDKKVYPNSLSSAECMILITQCIRFRLQYDRSEIEEVMSCQQIMDYLYKSEKSKQVWKSQCISGYERTITRKETNYDDSSYNQ